MFAQSRFDLFVESLRQARLTLTESALFLVLMPLILLGAIWPALVRPSRRRALPRRVNRHLGLIHMVPSDPRP